MQKMMGLMRRCIDDYHMIEDGDRVAVGVSGGKDSLTLLYTLAASPGRVFTRDNLLTIVWGYEFAGNYRAVDSHIKRLRAKLDAYPHDTFTIATVWGAGYKFERNLP